MTRGHRRAHLWLWAGVALAVVAGWVASRLGGVP
jgi:hypothetical protein